MTLSRTVIHFLARGAQVIHGFFNRFRAAAHKHDDVGCVGRAVVLVRLVFSAGYLLYVFHRFFHYCGNGFVILVARLAVLEVDVGVLRGALLNGVFGVECAGLEFADIRHVLFVHHLLDVRIIYHLYLAHFVGSAETVEEVQERHFRLQRGKMRDKRQVHNFLDGVGSQHCKARLAAAHHVAVVAEYVQRVVRQRPCAHMEYAGGQLARNFIHIGNHEQQALACGESGGQSACRQSAVHGARGARFGLHFGNSQLLTENVLPVGGSPFVRVLRHGGRRGDGINSRHFAHGIGDMSRGGISVNSHFLCHTISSERYLLFYYRLILYLEICRSSIIGAHFTDKMYKIFYNPRVRFYL